MKYSRFEPIGSKSNLAMLFDKVLDKLNISRMVYAPKIFEDINGDHYEKSAGMFYETCLWEMYLHGTFKRLHEWKEIITEYIDEFDSNWVYYASSKRIDCIREYGGEPSDYNEDGSIKTDVDNNELLSYSVISDLVFDDWMDIVQDTKTEHLNGLFRAIQIDSGMCIFDFFQSIGHELKTYRRDENGNMVEMTWADKELDKVSKRDFAENLSLYLMYIHMFVRDTIDGIRALDKTNDNERFFTVRLALIQDIIDLKFNLDLDKVKQNLITLNNPPL